MEDLRNGLPMDSALTLVEQAAKIKHGHARIPPHKVKDSPVKDQLNSLCNAMNKHAQVKNLWSSYSSTKHKTYLPCSSNKRCRFMVGSLPGKTMVCALKPVVTE